MSTETEESPNGPARGPSFSVVAPAIGVCVFLAVLAASRCDAGGEAVTSATPPAAHPGAATEPVRGDAP